MNTHPAIRQPPPSIRERMQLRAAVEHTVRSWFASSDALEIAAPTLVPSPGMEPHLRAFRIEAIECKELGVRYLHTSPEYAIKTALHQLGGDVYTLARCYRDEAPSRLHHAEFTMLEWYRRTDELDVLMHDCEAIVLGAADAVTARFGGSQPAWLRPDFRRMRCDEAFSSFAGIDLLETNEQRFAQMALDAGADVGLDWSRDEVFSVVYADLVEPALVKDGPAFITHFPSDQAALARLDPADPRWALRFELHVPSRTAGRGSIELANAFAELTDPLGQRRRFAAELAWRGEHGRPEYPMPEAMLAALPAMAPTVGIALGLERLMLWLAEETLGWQTAVADYLISEPIASVS